MKLYATVTSERASKGQGGNQFLDVQLFYGSADKSVPIGVISLYPLKNGYEVTYTSEKNRRQTEVLETIGEQQKGETA
jgi:hypothetical protein